MKGFKFSVLKSHGTFKVSLAFFVFISFNAFSRSSDGKIYAENLENYSPDIVYGGLECLFTSCVKEVVENPSNTLEDNGSFSTLYSSPGLLGLGGYNGFIEIGFDDIVPANTPTYIRVDGDQNLFQALLAGTLGDLLSDVLGAVLGMQIIQVIAYDESGNVVLDENSNGGLSSGEMKVVMDENGEFYFRIVPQSPYKSIRIANKSSALVSLETEFTLDVYHAFHFDPLCNYLPEFVSYDGDGISLDALGLGGGTVSAPQNSIDGDAATSSSLSTGLAGVAGSMSQLFYFSNISDQSDEVMVTISGDPTLLNLELFSNLSFIAYDGDTEVYNEDLGALADELLGLLKLDLLGLLMDGEQVTFPISPDLPFDRFEIKVNSLLDVDVFEALNIHEVERTIGMPSFEASASGNEYAICEGESLSISPSSYTGTGLKWYDEAGNYIGTGESLNLNSVNSDETYYVASSDNCDGTMMESARVAVKVDALKVPQLEDYQALPSVAEYGEGEKVVLEPFLELDADIENPEFYWSFSPDGDPEIVGEEIIDKGDHDVTYRVLPNGDMEIEGLVADEEIDEVYLILQNGETGCKSVQAVEQVFKILPLTWGSFLAKEKESGIELNWFVGLDRGVDKFIVQRSFTGVEWMILGEINYENSVLGEGSFDFDDDNPAVGNNYYRVIAVDIEGEMEYSKVIRAEFQQAFYHSFSISPNPVYEKPKLYNRTGNLYNDLILKAFDRNGIVVYHTAIDEVAPWSHITLDDNIKLQPGVYVYCLFMKGEIISRSKVIW
ncbi:hypothetical protein KZP23_10810 [Echinicola marina]|uniref:immunoglobulin domain-containing protein n=1 Tax=Echinicola marina TaxID=2859768 RepID=UPI001CF6060A|nr:hypothetical protein [Echinicola marina]UCS95461.1 hypothetical protein KZP23_10810 [Echinicola marina]